MNRYGELASRLTDIACELDDLAGEILRDAVATGARSRPAADRVLTQARRAVEKGAQLVKTLDGERHGDDDGE